MAQLPLGEYNNVHEISIVNQNHSRKKFSNTTKENNIYVN